MQPGCGFMFEIPHGEKMLALPRVARPRRLEVARVPFDAVATAMESVAQARLREKTTGWSSAESR